MDEMVRERPESTEEENRRRAMDKMAREIGGILEDRGPSIYLYGSSVLEDFRLGWSDIDILVLTERRIEEDQAGKLVGLRQAMLEREPGDPYYRSFEGGMLTLDAFLSGAPDRVVYWGTSGQRIDDHYTFASFERAELLERGVLLYGEDVRSRLNPPSYAALYEDVKRHYEVIRQYVRRTGRDLYAFGWMLDIARCIYTLRAGRIISKTGAGAWALERGLCPDRAVLEQTLEVRLRPSERLDERTLDLAETLAGPIQRFADVLERELREAAAKTVAPLSGP